MSGDAEICELLIKNKSDINKVNQSGWTPLINASYWNNHACLECLLNNNCDLTIRNNVRILQPRPMHNTRIRMVELPCMSYADRNPPMTNYFSNRCLYWSTAGRVSMTRVTISIRGTPRLILSIDDTSSVSFTCLISRPTSRRSCSPRITATRNWWSVYSMPAPMSMNAIG